MRIFIKYSGGLKNRSFTKGSFYKLSILRPEMIQVVGIVSSRTIQRLVTMYTYIYFHVKGHIYLRI